MTKPNARPRLRLVRTSTSTENVLRPAAPDESGAAVGSIIRSVFLPFAKDTLYLRMEPCVCGGAQIFYVKIVPLRDLEDHKPILKITGDMAEEIIISEHVEYKNRHRFFGISPVKLVFKHVLKLRRKALVRDMRLEISVLVKKHFEDAFQI